MKKILLLTLLLTSVYSQADTVNTNININKEINKDLDIGFNYNKFSDRFNPDYTSTKVGPYVKYRYDSVTVRYKVSASSTDEYDVNYVDHSIGISIDF